MKQWIKKLSAVAVLASATAGGVASAAPTCENLCYRIYRNCVANGGDQGMCRAEYESCVEFCNR